MPPAYLLCETIARCEFVKHGCVGKERFTNPAIAARVAAKKSRGPREHYKCDDCGYFHVGSRNQLGAKDATR